MTKKFSESELLEAIYWLCYAVIDSHDVFKKTITFKGSNDDAIDHLIQRYPIIQGTRNQINLRRLGERAPKLIKSGGIFEKLLSECEVKNDDQD